MFVCAASRWSPVVTSQSIKLGSLQRFEDKLRVISHPFHFTGSDLSLPIAWCTRAAMSLQIYHFRINRMPRKGRDQNGKLTRNSFEVCLVCLIHNSNLYLILNQWFFSRLLIHCIIHFFSAKGFWVASMQFWHARLGLSAENRVHYSSLMADYCALEGQLARMRG